MVKIIVITGSTRGIGFGLAESFLKMGCSVVVSGRSQSSVDKAVAELSTRYDSKYILGQACDVTQFDDVQRLWDAAKARFGRVDIWINNAGIGNVMMPFWEQPPENLSAVVNTDVTGLMYGAKVAISGMIEQGSGHIYNMEGFGSDGRISVGLTPYGTTKYAVRYLAKALVKETKGTSVKVSTLSPGIVITDFLSDGYKGRDPAEFERAKRIYNIIGDRVETVTPYLAEKVLANDKSGARIEWLTTPQVFARFLTASFRKRDLFSENSD